MGVKVSHDDVVTTGVEKKAKNRHEIERTGGVRRGSRFHGCYEEELGDLIVGEEVVGGCRRWSVE